MSSLIWWNVAAEKQVRNAGLSKKRYVENARCTQPGPNIN